jgi:hypothetical protein
MSGGMVGATLRARPDGYVGAMTGIEFAQTLARELNLPPLEEAEITALLELASLAAHGSERLAAPLCTYLAGKSVKSLDDVHTAVNRLIESGG